MKNVIVPKFTGDGFTKDKEYKILSVLGFYFVEVFNDDNIRVRINFEDVRFNFYF